MNWISVDMALPSDGQRVLVRVNLTNVWRDNNTIIDRIKIATFRRGKTKEENTGSVYLPWDEWGSNFRPYAWVTNMSKFNGQEVTHWCAIENVYPGDTHHWTEDESCFLRVDVSILRERERLLNLELESNQTGDLSQFLKPYVDEVQSKRKKK